MKYMIVIEKVPKNYAAHAPDLPGYVATAKARADVIRPMHEGVALHVEDLRAEENPSTSPQATVTETDVALSLGS